MATLALTGLRIFRVLNDLAMVSRDCWTMGVWWWRRLCGWCCFVGVGDLSWVGDDVGGGVGGGVGSGVGGKGFAHCDCSVSWLYQYVCPVLLSTPETHGVAGSAVLFSVSWESELKGAAVAVAGTAAVGVTLFVFVSCSCLVSCSTIWVCWSVATVSCCC